MTAQRRAVVLLSGGLDSSTTLAVARSDGFEPHALTFRYGQRHELEVAAARRVARHLGVTKHVVLDVDLGAFGGSALTASTPVPKRHRDEEMGSEIPATYVPARNTVFLSIALAFAEVSEAYDIFIGVNALDYSGYPDCRPEYIESFERMANLATKAAVEGGQRLSIHTPLMRLTKKEIVELGVRLGVDFSLTFTCYDPSNEGLACGECDACRLRLKGFSEAGVDDPLPYQAGREGKS